MTFAQPVYYSVIYESRIFGLWDRVVNYKNSTWMVPIIFFKKWWILGTFMHSLTQKNEIQLTLNVIIFLGFSRQKFTLLAS